MNHRSTFLQFLQSQGDISIKAPADYPALASQTTLTPLTNTGLIAIEGEQARQFLQGQLTCDLDQITADTSLPGAQCNPKGRVLCNFQLLEKDDDSLLMSMSSDLIEETLPSLKKYAVFFKAELTDATNEWVALGLAGPDAESILKTTLGTVPANINGVTKTDKGLVIKLADQCFQLFIPTESAEVSWIELSKQAKPVGLPLWQHKMIHAGLGQVVAETRGMFIPQMLNLQAINGISFNKGCYTGQEVVARMKYLGKLKRRMYRLQLGTNEAPVPGCDCHLSEAGQSIGNIVNAVQVDPDTVEALVVLTESAAQSEHLIIDGTTLTTKVLSLPYSLEAS